MILSIDVETYGMVAGLPQQNHFHPQRSIHQDGVKPSDLIQTCSITEGVKHTDNLSSIQPGATRVFQLSKSRDRTWLAQWLSRATTLIGFNIAFDILYLRTLPEYRSILSNDKQTLIDVSVWNTYESDARSWQSLKDLAQTLHVVPETWAEESGHRYPSAEDPDLIRYNALDTHIPILILAELIHRLQSTGRWENPDYQTTFLSDLVWSCIRMSEAGIAFSVSNLRSLQHTLEAEKEATFTEARDSHNLLLGGPGTVASVRSFLDALLDDLNTRNIDVSSLKLTPVRKDISWDSANQKLLAAIVPSDHPAHAALQLANRYISAKQVLTHYVNQLLTPTSKASVIPVRGTLLHPPSSDLAFAWPTWYAARGPTKDTQGGLGGTVQVRFAARNPPGQTFPPEVADCQRSRYPRGVLLSGDMSQMEMRTAAVLSGDPSLIIPYQNNRDLHTELAIACEGKSILSNPHFHTGDRRLDPRQWYKQSNFLMLYRGGAHRLRTTLLKLSGKWFPYSWCCEVVNRTRNHYSGLMQWHDRLLQEVEETGRLILPPTYHSRTFYPTQLPEIANFPVQTAAAITLHRIASRLTNTSLPPLSQTNVSVAACQNIHDSIVLDCRTPAIADDMQAAITSAVNWVAEHDYWARLCETHCNFVPLSISFKRKESQ